MTGDFTAHNWTDDQGRPAGGVVNGTGFVITWQNGPLGSPDDPDRREPNGAFVEDVIAAALQRIEHYQNTQFACEENEDAIDYLNLALKRLEDRTSRRVADNTEGTHEGN